MKYMLLELQLFVDGIRGMRLIDCCKWIALVAILLGAHAEQAGAQERKLTLVDLCTRAVDFYPALRAARNDAKASQQDVTAARLQRWPAMTVTSESNSGNSRTYPAGAVQVQQTVWDFGRTSSRIAEAEATADIGMLSMYLQRQDLFLQIVSAWQSMQAGREKIRVAELTLGRLRQYQQQMRRRVELEASAQIDLELVDARLLQTEVELNSAKTTLKVAITKLEQLTGQSLADYYVNSAESMPNLNNTARFTEYVSTADLHSIAQANPSVAKARAQFKQAQERFEGKKSEAWPQVYVRVYKPTNTVPSSSDMSTTTFLGMSYAPGAGFSTIAEAQAMSTRITSAELSIESATLDVEQNLQSLREEYLNSRLRILALEKTVVGSELVLNSYKRQFEAGKKTWLDLLNAVRELAQNQYSLADAQSSMMANMQRLQVYQGDLPQ